MDEITIIETFKELIYGVFTPQAVIIIGAVAVVVHALKDRLRRWGWDKWDIRLLAIGLGVLFLEIVKWYPEAIYGAFYGGATAVVFWAASRVRKRWK